MVVRFRKSHSLLSTFFLVNLSVTWAFVSCSVRAQAEHKIFQKLQAIVPNLLDRVFESEAAFAVVAESV
jgi:hypothetical protein